jgi:hypothetical protein
MVESCVFYCTTASAHTKINAVDKNPKTALKAMRHMTCTLSIRPHVITNATPKNKPFTFRKHGRPPVAIGFGDLKRRQEWSVACAMVLHLFAKLCTK